MTQIQIAEKEKQLNMIERKYTELMRKSFEVSLNNREKARAFHKKAEALYDEIMDTRKVLNYA
ncbi:Lacal_2735 family protein [Nonlabens antarcticus]|uniref:Lacal_2735 family protein n=1 Tax=Nonlabens antarcticus TaxID=392714 RepID=UPI00189121AF|nr:Lacal_2735 family protein [Nonlabens antarcticus]